MSQDVLQDQLEFPMSVDEMLVNDTINVVVAVEAMLPRDRSDEQFRRDVRAALDGLIPGSDAEDGEWRFSDMRRTPRAGMEAVAVTASARVGERHAQNLAERTEALTTEGLSFRLRDVDMAIPQRMIADCEKRLRVALAREVLEEVRRMSEVFGNGYRVHAIQFYRAQLEAPAARRARDPGMDFLEEGPPAAGAAGIPSEKAFGSAKRITLTADVTLAVVVSTSAA